MMGLLWSSLVAMLAGGLSASTPLTDSPAPTSAVSNAPVESASQSSTDKPPRYPIEISAAGSSLLAISSYAGSISGSFGLAVQGPVASAWAWQAGGYLGLGGLRPEAFVGLLATPTIGAWKPAAGIVLGVASVGDLGEGRKALEELRSDSVDSVSPFYLAIDTKPLSFRFARRFRISALDVQVGTHLSPLGRVLRLRLGILSLGMEL